MEEEIIVENNSQEIEVKQLANKAWPKCLASAIMCWFPILSYIAMFMGFAGFSKAKKAGKLAEQYGISAGGRNVASKVLGLVGGIAGIVYSFIYTLYIVYFVIWIVLFGIILGGLAG